MSKDKTVSPLVDFKLRLPVELDRKLRERAAARWQDRNTYVRELIRLDVIPTHDDLGDARR